MVKEQSNKAKKRATKEAELLESSWRLAHTMYGPMWGEERWSELSKALRAPSSSLMALNNYSDKSLAVKDEFDDWTRHNHLVYRHIAPDEAKKEMDALTGDCGAFYVDNESLTIIKCLNLEEGMSVLDMYSHIESTTMLLLQSILGLQLSVTINEHTPDKYQKLKKVVHASLPSNIPTRLTGWDTLKFGVNETAQYDRVLLDCPCSDERRVFNDEKLVKKWTDKVSRQNAKKQLLWLISALAATKPGGVVTYVARTLSQYEHDEIIEKVLKKSRVESIPVKITLDVGSMTKFGWLIMPDEADGGNQGPLYIAKLRVTE